MGDSFNEFLDAKRAEFIKRREARGKEEYVGRLRFRIGSPLNVDDAELALTVLGAAAVLSSRNAEVPIKKSEWLVLKAGFDSADEAIRWVDQLQDAVALGAAAMNAAIDVGPSRRATAEQLAEPIEMIAKRGFAVVEDVHGAMVHPAESVLMSFGDARLFVGKSVSRFFEEVETAAAPVAVLDDQHRNAVLMINAARMTDEPLARLVLAVGAVEILSQEGRWSDRQKGAINDLRTVLLNFAGIAAAELEELDAALARARRLGVLESSRRLLRGIGLDDLIPEWTRLYGMRSSILHGGEPAIHADVSTVANTAIEMSTTIVLRAVSTLAPI